MTTAEVLDLYYRTRRAAETAGDPELAQLLAENMGALVELVDTRRALAEVARVTEERSRVAAERAAEAEADVERLRRAARERQQRRRERERDVSRDTSRDMSRDSHVTAAPGDPSSPAPSPSPHTPLTPPPTPSTREPEPPSLRSGHGRAAARPTNAPGPESRPAPEPDTEPKPARGGAKRARAAATTTGEPARYPHYPPSATNRLYEAWREYVGPADYARFRRDTAGLFTADGPLAPLDELVGSIEVCVAHATHQRDEWQRPFDWESLSPRRWAERATQYVEMYRDKLRDPVRFMGTYFPMRPPSGGRRIA